MKEKTIISIALNQSSKGKKDSLSSLVRAIKKSGGEIISISNESLDFNVLTVGFESSKNVWSLIRAIKKDDSL